MLRSTNLRGSGTVRQASGSNLRLAGTVNVHRGSVTAFCQQSNTASECRSDVKDTNLSGRRPVLLGALALLGIVRAPEQAQAGEALTAAVPVAAEGGSGVTRFEDPVDKFGLDIPSNWVQAEGAIPNQGGFAGSTGARRTIAFFPPNVSASAASVSVTITNVSFEFTKLGSFGNVGTFAQNLVNSLDRSFLLRQPSWKQKSGEPIQIANLIDYSEKNEQYLVEYTVQKLPEPQRHLLSKLALGNNGTYNRLYTLTAQCAEEDLPQYRATFQKAVDSFKANVKAMA